MMLRKPMRHNRLAADGHVGSKHDRLRVDGTSACVLPQAAVPAAAKPCRIDFLNANSGRQNVGRIHKRLAADGTSACVLPQAAVPAAAKRGH